MSGTQAQESVSGPFVAATDEQSVVEKVFAADGKVSGHGSGAWLPASPAWALDIPRQELVAGEEQRVVAVLDTGIQAHEWLLQDGQDLWSTDPGWPEREPADLEKCGHRDGEGTCFGSHAGHASFVAGSGRVTGLIGRALIGSPASQRWRSSARSRAEG